MQGKHRQGAVTAYNIPRISEARATGNHRVAQNDEPEPGDLTEADLQEIDRQYGIDKRSGALERRRLHRAIEAQVNDPSTRGRL